MPKCRKFAESGHRGCQRRGLVGARLSEVFPTATRDLHLQLGSAQGCQMVCFQAKNPNLGKFWRALEWKMLVYFTVIWNI
jgi:hypothetical protein